jgi:hypothetical protein
MSVHVSAKREHKIVYLTSVPKRSRPNGCKRSFKVGAWLGLEGIVDRNGNLVHGWQCRQFQWLCSQNPTTPMKAMPKPEKGQSRTRRSAMMWSMGLSPGAAQCRQRSIIHLVHQPLFDSPLNEIMVDKGNTNNIEIYNVSLFDSPMKIRVSLRYPILSTG